MGSRWEKIKRIDKEFDTIFRNRSSTFIVHYSCESFYESKKDSFKIASIAVRNINSGQVSSFSIHLSAEKHKVDLTSNYEEAEKKLLDDYFSFLRANQNSYWVHWNMRDSNYGFKAIEHRYEVLGGIPILIPDNNKFDMARMLVERFTNKYIGHPRLESLMKLNDISDKNFLNGDKESQAFTQNEFVKLHQSTLKKVDVMEDILTKIDEGNLKVDANFFRIYGLSLESINQFLYSHPLVSFFTIIAGLYGLYKMVVDFFNKS